MATTNELLQAISNMQLGAQEALPVIPNNGNPGGAYNMPQEQKAQQPQQQATAYPWLGPSPAMSNVRSNLDAMRQRRGMMQAQPQQPMQVVPTMQFEPDVLPVLPLPYG